MAFPPQTRFFAALAAALAGRFDPEHPAFQLAEAAARGDDPAAVLDAQRALAALPDADRDAVMAETHRRLREDISAIWDLLPGAPGPDGPVN
ncbi:MAG: hypothetical protein KDA73_14445 [Rhodobacteraceae bacterium]|nr:hypothetical protein [Paracoccaceae bacterium]